MVRMAPETTLTTGRTNPGFTLIELILVMVIISVILALAAPSLHGISNARDTAETSLGILSMTRHARTTAIAEGSPVRLNLDAQAGRLWLTVQQAGVYVTPQEDMFQGIDLPAGATASITLDPNSAQASQADARVDSQWNVIDKASPRQAPTYIQFYPSGRSDIATIELQGAEGQVYRVSCPSVTEGFDIQEGAQKK